MTGVVLRGADVLGPDGWRRGEVVVRDGIVRPAGEGDGLPVVDLDGQRVVPGFVDLQCNGGLGIDVTTEPERIWELAAALPRWGVTAWLPTVVSSPPAAVDAARAVVAAGPPDGWVGAVPLGLHVEGPFLDPAHRGAHDPSFLRSPSIDAVAEWSPAAGVVLVTLAPELDGALDVIGSLVRRGVTVSIGHTGADTAAAQAAVDAGASWVTHLFNAMSPLHHREPGPVGVALSDERLRVGLITDGIHVDPLVVSAVQRALGTRITLVTDAVSALGMPAGTQRLDRREVVVADGAVRLPDGTLAGSVLSMDQAVSNLVTFSGCGLDAAIHAASTAPAAVVRDASRGRLVPGARADVVVLDAGCRVVATLVGGEVVHGEL